MSAEVNSLPSSEHDWDVYWAGTQQAAAHQDGGAQDKVLGDFWLAFFKQHILSIDRPRVLDIACGNGAVSNYLHESAKNLSNKIVTSHCLDYSQAAVAQLKKRLPHVLGVSANANQTPFQNGTYNLVVSQFGLEYAGLSALPEALRLIADDGYFAAIMHLKNGAIYNECERNLDAIQRVQESRFIDLSNHAFRAGYAALIDPSLTDMFRQADRNLTPAIQRIESLLRSHGSQLAGGTIEQLYTDTRYMYQRIRNFDSQEVYTYLERMQSELHAYSGRMSSMLDSATDSNEFKTIAEQFEKSSLRIVKNETLLMGKSQSPAAWVLVAHKCTTKSK